MQPCTHVHLDLCSVLCTLFMLCARFDEMRACLHLDVMGKEYVLRCDTKEETLEWYVAIAQGCGLT